MKITRIEIIYLRLPELKQQCDSGQDVLLVRVHTDAGPVVTAADNADVQAWDKALEHAEANYDVKPIGVSRNVWFAKGWKFAAPFDVIIDPFTLKKTA